MLKLSDALNEEADLLKCSLLELPFCIAFLFPFFLHAADVEASEPT